MTSTRLEQRGQYELELPGDIAGGAHVPRSGSREQTADIVPPTHRMVSRSLEPEGPMVLSCSRTRTTLKHSQEEENEQAMTISQSQHHGQWIASRTSWWVHHEPMWTQENLKHAERDCTQRNKSIACNVRECDGHTMA